MLIQLNSCKADLNSEIFSGHGLQNVQHRKLLVRARVERHIGKPVWVAVRPSLAGSFVFPPAPYFMKGDQIQKKLVEISERAHQAGITHTGLSGMLCENILIAELRKALPGFNFDRGVVRFNTDQATHKKEGLSSQIDVIIYRGKPLFAADGVVAVPVGQVLGVIEVKKWIYPKMLTLLKESIKNIHKIFKEKSGRPIPIFLVAFRIHERKAKNRGWFYKQSNFPTPYKYAFFGKFSRADKRILYPWEEEIWSKFDSSPYAGQFNKLVSDIKSLVKNRS